MRADLLDLDTKLQQALAPHLARVLIADPTAAAARMLTDLLNNIGRGNFQHVSTTAQAMGMVQLGNPQIIFTEYSGPDLDGLEFTRMLRRSNFSCRKVPVIMVTAQATPTSILGARDSGVHEFLRKPYTNKDLMRRLEAALLRPRGWVEAVGYIGPDRRRFNSGEYAGARKRRTDKSINTDQAAANQALRIVAAAVAAIEHDREQAFRSLATQAVDLQRAAAALRNEPLKAAATELGHYLAAVGAAARLTRNGVEPFARKLLVFLPKDEARPAA